MSEEHGDSAAGAGTSGSSARGDEVGGRAAAGVTDPALASHLETIHQSMSSLGSRIDALDGKLAGLGDKIEGALETTTDESGSVATVLEELKVTLQDLASGEVVGSLWDEFRHLRATVETLVEHTGESADPGAVEALRAEVVELTGSVQELLDRAEVDGGGDGDGDGETVPAPIADGLLDQLAADVASLRRELAEGLVLEASADLGSSVDQLREELAGVAERVAALAEVPDTVAERLAPLGETRDRVAELADAVADLRDHEARAPAPAPAPVTVDTSELDEELRAVRAGVEDIIARLDEGLDLEIDTSGLAPAPPAGAPDAKVTSELADQVAALRDFISSEFDAIRQQLTGAGLDASAESVDLVALTARLDRLHDDIADQQSLAEELAGARGTAGGGDGGANVDLTPVTGALAELQEAMAYLLDRSTAAAEQAEQAGETAPGSSPEFATLDPDSVDLLREEIRASATPSAELIDTLNTELKALRRRIRLRAEGEIFSDEQLELIADAVARRLADEQ